jgi:uncharacterized protein
VIVLDTAVLTYALGSEHPLREPSRRVVAAITEGVIDGSTTAEVVQEFAHVTARRHGRPDAVKRARLYVQLLSPLLQVETQDLDLGLRLYEQHSALGSFDALLAAVAMNHDAQALVSPDHGFAGIRRLRHIDPGGPEFEELLNA